MKNSPEKALSPTDTNHMLGERVTMIGQRKLFHELTKVNMARVARAGPARGIIIRRKIA